MGKSITKRYTIKENIPGADFSKFTPCSYNIADGKTHSTKAMVLFDAPESDMTGALNRTKASALKLAESIVKLLESGDYE